jgi:hypothetical protein
MSVRWSLVVLVLVTFVGSSIIGCAPPAGPKKVPSTTTGKK